MLEKPEIYSKTPSFKHTGLESPITEFALGIMAHKNEHYYASGTAIVIGPRLAITAQHVIDDFFERFDGNELSGPSNSDLQVFQILNTGKSGLIWNITRLWRCGYTDIAVLHLTPTTQTTQKALKYHWRFPKLDLIPPKVGKRIAAFGYSNPNIDTNDNPIAWTVYPRTSIGEVLEVYHQKRDSCKAPYPCFHTNARYDGAMSGGPVFNDRGHLCGIICSTYPPFNNTDEHASYVTSLWPLMGMKINVNREGYPKNVEYPMLELARDGIIHTEGWEQVIIDIDSAGDIVQIGLNDGITTAWTRT